MMAKPSLGLQKSIILEDIVEVEEQFEVQKGKPLKLKF